MVIRIPSANIHNRENDKVLGNKIKEVSYVENNLSNEVGSIFNSNFSIYSSQTGNYTNNLNDYTNNISQNEYLPSATDIYCSKNGYQHYYAYFKVKNVKYPKINRKENLKLTIEHNETDNGSNVEYKHTISERYSGSSYYVGAYTSITAFEEETFYGYIGNVIDFSGYVKVGVVLRDNDFDALILLKTYEKDTSGSYYRIQQKYNISLLLDLYNKNSVEVNGEVHNAFKLSGNELLSNSTKKGGEPIGKALGNGIITSYKNGKETAKIRCSVSDYYDYYTSEKVISANNWQQIDTDKYVELWNATYDNGVVRQIVGETPFASGVANMNENIDEYGRYFQVYDKPMIPSLKINDSVTLNYKIDGKAYSLNTYIVDRYNGALALSSQQGSSSHTTLVLLNENGYSIVAYVNINATQQTDGQWVNIDSSSQIIAQVLTAPNGTPNIEIEIPSVGYQFHLQTYDTYPNIVSEYVKKVYYNGLVYFTFIKQDSFNYVRFKLNGEEIDTGISFDISSLENGKTYCFSANVNVEDGQGYISWDSMMLNYGARPKPFERFDTPMAFQLYDEVVPMVMRADGKDYPLSVDASGNAKVFNVLGINIYFDGAIWQELSLQEC